MTLDDYDWVRERKRPIAPPLRPRMAVCACGARFETMARNPNTLCPSCRHKSAAERRELRKANQ